MAQQTTEPPAQTTIAPDQKDLRALLAEIPYWQGIAPDALNALVQVAQCCRVPAGQVIFVEGDPCAGWYLVASGVVKICRYTEDGREHILALMQPGDSFNEVSVLDGGPNPATTIAHTDTVLWRVSREDFRLLSSRYPDLVWGLAQSMAARTRYLVRLVEDLVMRSVKGRLARLLLEQAQANQDAEVPRLLTQEEMAAHLGTVREMVGRAMRSLAASGLIEFDRHRIVILDPEGLEQEATA